MREQIPAPLSLAGLRHQPRHVELMDEEGGGDALDPPPTPTDPQEAATGEGGESGAAAEGEEEEVRGWGREGFGDGRVGCLGRVQRPART
jgi:hypothetical protein